ncbi:MAG: Rpn family recombination-promoting nuclease/putative transposase [Cytophagales bacterium]|nr:Rpn family recombination-promoting nuclease/putative transposase [Cytophagales bacterium]
MTEKYINPFTDFGFKKLFGEEANKDLLIDFLNEVIHDKAPILQLTFLKNEQLGSTPTDRKAVFDLYCENERGERFIVELQKARQKFFKDRSLYYSTFAIQEQAKTGDWDFRLQSVYSISIMDFVFDEAQTHQHKFRHDVKLVETETGVVFNDKLSFVYLEMPKFNKHVEELETRYDKWLYVLKNLPRLEKIPEKLRERIFLRLFESAEIAKYNPQEQRSYQDSVKAYRDWKNVLDTAVEEATNQAFKQKELEIAKRMKTAGEPVGKISLFTGLSIEEIENL